MKERIIILGAGVMQGPAIRIAKEMELETFVFDADTNAPCRRLADHFECIDLKDTEKIEAFARSLKETGGLAGIMTAGTDFSASVAWTAEKLHLPGISYQTAINASDKGVMRLRFAEAGVPSPKFITIHDIPPQDFSLPFDFPTVVKPVDNMGGRGCRKVSSQNDLALAVKDSLHFSRSRKVIIEEYMDGPEFSVDAIVHNGNITMCGLADRHIFFPPYFIEMGHTMPTNIDAESQNAIFKVFTQGVKALGIQNGAAKGDIKLTQKGPMIGEIAARLSGGYMSGWTYPYSSGVEPARAAIQVAIGTQPDTLTPAKNWTSAERAFISIPGKVKSMSGIDEAKNMPHIKDIFLRIEKGSSVQFPVNNVSKCGNIISAAPTREEAVYAAEKAAQSILIHLESPNEETEHFLQTHTDFPPSAFSLNQNQLNQLRTIPQGNPILTKDKTVIIHPFPEFTQSNLIDFVGRTIPETFAAISKLSGFHLELAEEIPQGNSPNADLKNEKFSHHHNFLGKEFWQSLIRGAYQGAVYYLDTLSAKENV
jgi:biotin carboxylase